MQSNDSDHHDSTMELDVQKVSTISLPRDEMLDPPQYHRQSQEKSTAEFSGHIDTSDETLPPPWEIIDSSSSGDSQEIGLQNTVELGRGDASTDVHNSVNPRWTNTTRLDTVGKVAPQPFFQTRLGRVPPEIREIIWKFVFDAPREIEFGFIPAVALPETSEIVDPKISAISSWITNSALLRTCRTIYQETQHIYYSETTFHFTDSSKFLTFLDSVTPTDRESIRSFHIGDMFHREPISREVARNEFGVDEWTDGDTMVTTRPDARKAFVALRDCGNLTRLFVDLEVGEQQCLMQELLSLHGIWFGELAATIHVKDDFHWILKWVPMTEQGTSGNEFSVCDVCFTSECCCPGENWVPDSYGKACRVQVDLTKPSAVAQVSLDYQSLGSKLQEIKE